MVRIIIGVVIGGTAGLGYWQFVECRGGVCPLASDPYAGTVFGAVMDALFAHG